MSVLEAIIMGILQGLTEFLPVSSSGHLELASYLFGIESESNLQFTMAVHAATVLSTITVFYRQIAELFRGLFRFRMNDETRYVLNLLLSMIPIGIVGLFFKDAVEGLFTSNLLLVGAMLLVTACLLTFAGRARPRSGKITPKNAFVIGIAQALAVLPGLSRSGATISTGLLLGVERSEVSKFSFLMVLIPIIGMNLLEIIGMPAGASSVGAWQLAGGFAAAYLTGTLACRWMIRIVNRGKLVWFAVYCAAVGLVSIGLWLFN
ncbi:MAG TPA: undecaprenyl-diphosphate phosphatase [Candidatus Tidjanibacter gallistercoris]|nr:undecaprenyl-diphosphate phosphatase [Candidatus Tidjanibacter gallistercoris]